MFKGGVKWKLFKQYSGSGRSLAYWSQLNKRTLMITLFLFKISATTKNVKSVSEQNKVFFDVNKTFAEISIIFARRRKMIECDASTSFDVNKQLLSRWIPKPWVKYSSIRKQQLIQSLEATSLIESFVFWSPFWVVFVPPHRFCTGLNTLVYGIHTGTCLRLIGDILLSLSLVVS